jgi:hypothetical protein
MTVGLKELRVHDVLHVISKNSFYFSIRKMNYSFLLRRCNPSVASLVRSFLRFLLSGLIATYNQNSQVEVVKNLFERISFNSHFISFIEDSFAISKNACYHLECYTAVNNVEKNDHKPERVLSQVDMKSSHQVDEQKRICKKDLDQVVTDDHRQEENQTKLVEG